MKCNAIFLPLVHSVHYSQSKRPSEKKKKKDITLSLHFTNFIARVNDFSQTIPWV